MKAEFVPISHIGRNEGGKGQATIVMDAQFPSYVPTEEIGVNLNRLRKRCHIADVKTLVIGTDSGRRPRRTAPPVSLGSDGTAVGMLFARREEPERYDRQSENKIHSVTLDFQAMQTNIGTATPGSLRSARAWSKELNTSLEHAIFDAALDELLTTQDVWLAGYIHSGSVLFSTLLTKDGQLLPLWMYAGFYGIFMGSFTIGMLGLTDMLKRKDLMEEPYRKPLSRLAQLAVMTKKHELTGRQNLVQPLN